MESPGTDKNGNLWMWGGYGSDSQFSQINLNDLWEYSPATAEWVWVNGSNIGGEAGIYGTLGTAAATNVPGAREGAMSFTDKSGNFWLFGGDQNISSTGDPDFNDLWKYDVTTGEWTWMNGSNKLGGAGDYGTQGVAAAVQCASSERFGRHLDGFFRQFLALRRQLFQWTLERFVGVLAVDGTLDLGGRLERQR